MWHIVYMYKMFHSITLYNIQRYTSITYNTKMQVWLMSNYCGVKTSVLVIVMLSNELNDDIASL